METVKVFPPQTAAGQEIQLSLCDVYSPSVWVVQTHFWRLKDSTSYARIFQVLQEGLRRTVSEIPALAGTVGYGHSGDPRDLVLSIGSDAHVEFICEDLSGNDDVPPYDKLEAEGFPMTGLLAQFAPPITVAPVSAGACGLVAKLNLLKHGVALAWAFNHLFTDAGGIAEIEYIWAMHTADASSGKEGLYRTRTPDQDIRKQLSTPEPGVTEFDDPYWKEFPIEQSQLFVPRDTVKAESALVTIRERKQAELTEMGKALDETRWLMLYFSPDNLAKLKLKASGPDQATWISTMDALIGFFWSHLAAVQADIKEDEISSCVFPINIRARVEPAIPQQYIGNAVDVVFTECSLAQLASESGMRAGAQSIRKVVNGWSLSAWNAWRRQAIALPASRAIVPNPFMLLNPRNFAFNDYSKSKSNTLDWGADLGQIGRTRYMKPAASLANCATAVVVHPRLADGGLEVAMSCNAHVQDALEADESFQAYCTRICISA